MTLEQFKFKKSYEFGIKEVAELTTGKDSKVVIKKNDLFMSVIKTLNKRVVYNVAFENNEVGIEKLEKALKNISKRK